MIDWAFYIIIFKLKQKGLMKMIRSIRDYFTLGWQYIKVYKKPAFQAFDMKNAFITLDQAFDYVGDNSSYQ